VLNQEIRLDRIFQALADETRRSMIERLIGGPASVSELAKPYDISLPAVMQHLQVLESCELVRSEKIGRIRTCQIEPSGLRRAEGWIGELRSAWENRLAQLDIYLSEQRHSPGRATP
jgi:DNA-binding transcriptional ArsR family regulator